MAVPWARVLLTTLSFLMQVNCQESSILPNDIQKLCNDKNNLSSVIVDYQCYVYSNKKVGWDDAFGQCKNSGGKLAIILDNTTQSMLAQKADEMKNKLETSLWIGLRWHGARFSWDGQENRSCIVDDNQKIDCAPSCGSIVACKDKIKTYCYSRMCCYQESQLEKVPHCFLPKEDRLYGNYSFWANGQPDNGGPNQCGVLWNNGQWKWDDQNCNTENHFLCQYDITQSTTVREKTSESTETSAYIVDVTSTTNIRNSRLTSYEPTATEANVNTMSSEETTTSGKKEKSTTKSGENSSIEVLSSTKGTLLPTNLHPSTKSLINIMTPVFYRSSVATPSVTLTSSLTSKESYSTTPTQVPAGGDRALASPLSDAGIGSIAAAALLLVILSVLIVFFIRKRRKRGHITTQIIENMVSRDSRAYSEIPVDNLAQNPVFNFGEEDNRLSQTSTANVTVTNGEASVLYLRPAKKSKLQEENKGFLTSTSIDIDQTPLKEGEEDHIVELSDQPMKQKHQITAPKMPPTSEDYSYAQTGQNIRLSPMTADEESCTYSYAEVRQRMPDLKDYYTSAQPTEDQGDALSSTQMVDNPIYGN
ncbi:uncharacterized protein LOC106169887 [Lingula anatina]|uniref:Uncharacterized protein LOC106169887 n=1 Tax=Lingula anatina TaxID=7574 RepID=A0A1S3J3Z1_LINAN|nr:uncharacterized protein LOC106169887 [Lingula anatina]|eukprot:XP_013404981.1 uncharacterized protein LOC106169887 [Lingula anatina]